MYGHRFRASSHNNYYIYSVIKFSIKINNFRLANFIKIIAISFTQTLLHFQGVQLHIEIIDDDYSHSADDLIDVLLIEHNLPIGQPSPRKNYTGIYNISFVTMDLSITAKCAENFQGSDCSRCLPGFAGTMCNVGINECSCSGNGQCLDGMPSLICECDPGYTGVECEANIDDCIEVTCSENGQCIDGLLSYTCECDPGFTGVDCETNIDDCVGVNCSGNGVCFDDVNAFSCQCSPGFGGELCTKGNINYCLLNLQWVSNRLAPVVTFIAVMEIRDGLPLVPITGGVVGGVLTLSVLMVLVIIIMCRIGHKERRLNINTNLSKFLFLHFYSTMIKIIV